MITPEEADEGDLDQQNRIEFFVDPRQQVEVQDSSKDDSAVVILEKTAGRDQLHSREIREQRRDQELSPAAIKKSPRARATKSGLPSPSGDPEKPLSAGTFPTTDPRTFDPSDRHQQNANMDSHMDKEARPPNQSEAAKA